MAELLALFFKKRERIKLTDQVRAYLETEPGRNVLIEHALGDHRKRREEDNHCRKPGRKMMCMPRTGTGSHRT
jgi:hypothetical protein